MKVVYAFLLCVFASVSLAHGYLETSSPLDGASLSQAPTEIVLEFKENIETTFSIFKVYPLPEASDSTTEDKMTEHQEEHAADDHTDDAPSHSAMDSLAETFVPTVLELKDDPSARVDTSVLTTGTSKKVVIGLQENLPPGAYVVMWRVISVDTHTIDGYLTFEIVAP
jgi:copper resistance protein C